MSNFEHSKSTILGFILFVSVTIYKFAPYFFPEATYSPSEVLTIVLYGLSIGLIVLYPEPFTSIFKAFADNIFKAFTDKWSK